MAQLIKKQSSIGQRTIYFVGDGRWSDDRSKAKSFANVTAANAVMANPDGKNGGFVGASTETV